MNGISRGIFFVFLLTFALVGTASAQTAELVLVSGTTTTTIVDNGLLDTNSAFGTVNYTNPDFNGWDISVVSGVSDSPTASPIGIDLTTQATSAGENAPLDIFFGDVNFTPAVNYDTTYSVAMTGGSTSQLAWVGNPGSANPNTIELAPPFSGLVANIGPLTASGSATVAGSTPGVAPYSLTLEQKFTPSATSTSSEFFSADGDMVPTPEPSGLVLFGIGLLGLAAVCSQRKRLGIPANFLS